MAAGKMELVTERSAAPRKGGVALGFGLPVPSLPRNGLWTSTKESSTDLMAAQSSSAVVTPLGILHRRTLCTLCLFDGYELYRRCWNPDYVQLSSNYAAAAATPLLRNSQRGSSGKSTWCKHCSLGLGYRSEIDSGLRRV